MKVLKIEFKMLLILVLLLGCCRAMRPLRVVLGSFVASRCRNVYHPSISLKMLPTWTKIDENVLLKRVVPIFAPQVIQFGDYIGNISTAVEQHRSPRISSAEANADDLVAALNRLMTGPQEVSIEISDSLARMEFKVFYETLDQVEFERYKMPSTLRLEAVQLFNHHLCSIRDTQHISPMKVFSVMRKWHIMWSDLNTTSSASFSSMLTESVVKVPQRVALTIFGLAHMNATWSSLDPHLSDALLGALELAADSMGNYLDNIIYCLGFMRIEWASVPTSTQVALQRGLIKQLPYAGPKAIVRVAKGLSNMHVNHTALQDTLAKSLVGYMSFHCDNLAKYNRTLFISLSEMKFPRRGIVSNVGDLLDAAAKVSLKSNKGLAIHRLGLMNSTFSMLSPPFQEYLRDEYLSTDVVKLSTNNFAKTVKKLGSVISWRDMTPEGRQGLVSGLLHHIMDQSSSDFTTSVTSGTDTEQGAMSYPMLRYVAMRGLLQMRPEFSRLPSPLQAALLEHSMIIMTKNSPGRMAYLFNGMANTGMEFDKLPSVTQECILSAATEKIPLMNPRKLTVCLTAMARLGIKHHHMSNELLLKIADQLVLNKEELIKHEIRFSLGKFLKILYSGLL